METTEQLSPVEHQQEQAWPPGLNRAAMTADAEAVLSWLQSNAMWTSLDQTVRPLLGRSPLQIVSGLFSAVIELPELEVLLALALDRLMAYRGAMEPFLLAEDDRDALAALRGAALGAFA